MTLSGIGTGIAVLGVLAIALVVIFPAIGNALGT